MALTSSPKGFPKGGPFKKIAGGPEPRILYVLITRAYEGGDVVTVVDSI